MAKEEMSGDLGLITVTAKRPLKRVDAPARKTKSPGLQYTKPTAAKTREVGDLSEPGGETVTPRGEDYRLAPGEPETDMTTPPVMPEARRSPEDAAKELIQLVAMYQTRGA